MNKFVIILGVSADIGLNICKSYIKDGFQVLGTYRKFTDNMKEIENLQGLTLFKCDVTQEKDICKLVELVHDKGILWTSFFSSVGTSEPIGNFFEIPFEIWEHSIQINCLGQLHALHALFKYRASEITPNIIFLAGGGTNNPFKCYSAYCVSKIMLIKMCELLDDENPDLNIFIIGPGFVKTKTHLETIKAGHSAGDNYERVKIFLESDDNGTPVEKIYECIRYFESKGKKVASGRNFSVVHDVWGNEELAVELEKDINMYKLRRYKNDWHGGNCEK